MPDARKLFETLVREHSGMLTVFLRSMLGNSADLDDVFQETMVVAWRRLDEFDPARPFGPWLRGIARKLVLAHYRQRVRNLCTPAALDQMELRLDQLASQPRDSWQEKLEVLRGCVQTLPETYRSVVKCRYFQQQPIAQVSESLNISTAAVKKRLQRARALILDCVQGKLTLRETCS